MDLFHVETPTFTFKFFQIHLNLKGRITKRERQREIFHVLVHSPKGHNSHSLPGGRNSIQVSHVSLTGLERNLKLQMRGGDPNWPLGLLDPPGHTETLG